MKVFSEAITFQHAVWSSPASEKKLSISEEEEYDPDRLSPCPPSSSNSTSSALFRPVLPPLCPGNDKALEDACAAPKRLLEPMPTFTHDWRRDFLSPPSSPLSSPFRSLSPLPSPAFGGFGSNNGPAPEVRMGLGTPGGEKNDSQEEDLPMKPIKLAPIRLPPPAGEENNNDQEMRDLQPIPSISIKIQR